MNPVPRDLMLPLPIGEWTLQVLLVLSFLLHIVFVNLMVGGAVLTAVFEWVGLKWPRYDALARKIADTLTVNKSLAIVLGVGPLLCINLLYTLEFYTANALTGHAWLALIPSVTVAFLLTYWHKYTWQSWTGARKVWHRVLAVAVALCFLLIPFIFFANINLMLFPEKWSEVRGFFSSLQLGNVFPRYLHFLAASNAFTALFLAGWFGAARKRPKLPEGFEADGLIRMFYKIAFGITAAQFVFGPLVLLTLPARGISTGMLAVIWFGAFLGLVAQLALWLEITAKPERLGRGYWVVFAIFGCVVLCMGTGRHMYRENSLAEFRGQVRERTAEFRALEAAYTVQEAGARTIGFSESDPALGRTVFENCALCHEPVDAIVGPSLQTIYERYKDNPQALAAWTKKPGRRDEAFAPMPAFDFLSDAELAAVAAYMLELGKIDATGE